MTHTFTALAYSRPVPRYTSYPPSTQFHDLDEHVRLNALSEIQNGQSLSLYIHLPFCGSLCYYCGCFTTVTQRADRISTYLQSLAEEIRMVSALMPPDSKVVHMHFGGGSPTMLSPTEFSALYGSLKQYFHFSPQAEIAIEADPRQLNEEKISCYAQCGINRISFGVQDFYQPTMIAVNRRQEASLTQNAVELCRKYGISRINFDLMYGLPHQTVNSIHETIALAASMHPSRIAFFGYAHVPWMKKHMNALDCEAMPDTQLRYDLFKTGCAALAREGYKMVGIDHFVKTDDEMYRHAMEHTLHRNFQGYTADPASVLIGFGASAISKLPYGFVQNKADIAAYQHAVSTGNLAPARGWKAQQGDSVRAAIIESIMCYFEADLASFSPTPQQDFQQAFERLQPFIRDGVVRWADDKLVIEKEPPLMARLVASAFDTYTAWTDCAHAAPTGKHAQAI